MRHTHITTGTLIGIAALGFGATAVHAQTPEAIVLVDVVVVNDDGGTLDSTTVEFEHPNTDGTSTTGTDSTAGSECLTSDSGSCYIGTIPIGDGELVVPPVDGYTTTIECSVDDVAPFENEPPTDDGLTADLEELQSDAAGGDDTQLVAGRAASTASGATWNADPFAEIFCLVTLDDIEPTAPTTTVPPTTVPPTTTPPDTTPPVTAPPTTPVPTPVPADVLPATGPSDNTVLALAALILVGAGSGILRLARR